MSVPASHPSTRLTTRVVAAQRGLLEASPVAALIVDLEGHVLFSNAAAADLFGWQSDGSTAPLWPALADELLRSQSAARAAAETRASGPLRASVPHAVRDGGVADLRVSAAPISIDDGTVCAFAAYVEDSWRRERSPLRSIGARAAAGTTRLPSAAGAEEVDAHERLADRSARTLIDDLSAALTTSDVARVALAGGIASIGASVGALVLLDERSEEAVIIRAATADERDSVGRSGADFAQPAADRFPSDAVRPLTAVLRSREPLLLESPAAVRERYPELDPAWLEASVPAMTVLPLLAHDRAIGSLFFGFSTGRSFEPADALFMRAIADKTAQAIERARLFEAERNARLTLDTVIRQMPVGVMVAQPPKGRVVFANEEVDRIWRMQGRVVGDIDGYGEWVGFYPHGAKLEARDWPLARSLLDGVSVTAEEIEIVRGDGTRGAILVSAAPVRDATGAIVAAVATYSDVSDRREAEIMREAFVSVISHELRTPITSIYGGVQVLRRPPERLDQQVRREVIEDVAAETERLNRLVEDLLVLARVERGVPVVDMDPILLSHLLPRVVAVEQARWPTTRFALALPDHIPTIVGDEGHLEQVLRNLFSNAAKYGPANGVVEVAVDVNAQEVIVRVLDEGPGIEPDETEELFQLFYRSPRTAAAPGAGIGLFVARSLVAAMGGRIWARSRSKRPGAEFGIALRLFDELDDH